MTRLSVPFYSTIKEMESQEQDLPEYISYFRSLKLNKEIAEQTLFCGSGDSLACAQFTERLTYFKCRAIDPYDLMIYPNLARGKKVFFVSVSGRTIATVRAARIAKTNGARDIIAITSKNSSPLAKIASKVIELKFRKTPELTPGTNSFTTSLLACLLLFQRAPKLHMEQMIEEGKEWTRQVADFPGAVYFVGGGDFLPLAMYGAAKMFEFVGGKAEYQLLEQFSHMNLFSIDKRRDRVFILRRRLDEEKALLLDANLTEVGVSSYLLPVNFNRKIELGFSYAILLQYLALKVALKRGLKQPSFLRRKELLHVSDRMIY